MFVCFGLSTVSLPCPFRHTHKCMNTRCGTVAGFGRHTVLMRAGSDCCLLDTAGAEARRERCHIAGCQAASPERRYCTILSFKFTLLRLPVEQMLTRRLLHAQRLPATSKQIKTGSNMMWGQLRGMLHVSVRL